MVDVDRMFSCELATFAEQPTDVDLWIQTSIFEHPLEPDDLLPPQPTVHPPDLTLPSIPSESSDDTDDHTPAVPPSRPTTKVPVPIPNLTKKSRGRKVPTSNGQPHAPSRDKTKKGSRNNTCPVSGCGKCFFRGEHLKRHIRSIHTHEKPWRCDVGSCTRAFSRQDNLNQHLRTHKRQSDDD